MKYQHAKDVYDELKNFEGTATFKGDDTVIDMFVLLPESEAQNFDVQNFLEHHKATGGFEIEGNHNESYTIIGINTAESRFSSDTDYFMSLLVW